MQPVNRLHRLAGLANSDRGAFWLGLGLLTSRIIIWFLMTQNDLMTKSLLFIVCLCAGTNHRHRTVHVFLVLFS